MRGYAHAESSGRARQQPGASSLSPPFPPSRKNDEGARRAAGRHFRRGASRPVAPELAKDRWFHHDGCDQRHAWNAPVRERAAPRALTDGPLAGEARALGGGRERVRPSAPAMVAASLGGGGRGRGKRGRMALCFASGGPRCAGRGPSAGARAGNRRTGRAAAFCSGPHVAAGGARAGSFRRRAAGGRILSRGGRRGSRVCSRTSEGGAFGGLRRARARARVGC